MSHPDDYDIPKPKPSRGKDLDRLVGQWGIKRGWFETDKGLRVRALWKIYGGSPTAIQFQTPLWRPLYRLAFWYRRLRGWKT